MRVLQSILKRDQSIQEQPTQFRTYCLGFREISDQLMLRISSISARFLGISLWEPHVHFHNKRKLHSNKGPTICRDLSRNRELLRVVCVVKNESSCIRVVAMTGVKQSCMRTNMRAS